MPKPNLEEILRKHIQEEEENKSELLNEIKSLKKGEDYSKRELDTFFGDIRNHLEKQDGVLNRIEAQVNKTNGRVTGLENRESEFIKSHEPIKGHVEKLVIFRENIRGGFWIVSISSTVLIAGAIYLFNLYIGNMQQKISNDIIHSLSNNYSIIIK